MIHQNTFRRNVFIAVLLFIALLASAQEQPSNGPSVMVVGAPQVTVKAGGSSSVTLTFRVNNGFHINSNKPNSELLIPTSVKLSPPSEIMVYKIKYPEGQQLTFTFSPDEKLSVYSGDFKVSAVVRAAQKTSVGTYRVHGEVKFQACNDRQCFPPKTTPVDFDVKVAKGGASKVQHRSAQSPHIKS